MIYFIRLKYSSNKFHNSMTPFAAPSIILVNMFVFPVSLQKIHFTLFSYSSAKKTGSKLLHNTWQNLNKRFEGLKKLTWLSFNTRGVYNFITKEANIPVNLVPFFNEVSNLFCHFLKSGVWSTCVRRTATATLFFKKE